MSDPAQIEQDLREYLAQEPNLSRADRLKYLQTIFHKHLEINKLEHLVNYKDVFNIFSEARNFLVKTRFPMRISKRELETSEAAHIAVMEAFILYLSRTKLLTKIVKFDYKD